MFITWIPSSCHLASVIWWRIHFIRCEIYSLILSSASLRQTRFVIENEKKKQYTVKNFTIYTSWRPRPRRQRRQNGNKIWRWFVAITSCLENSAGESFGVCVVRGLLCNLWLCEKCKNSLFLTVFFFCCSSQIGVKLKRNEKKSKEETKPLSLKWHFVSFVHPIKKRKIYALAVKCLFVIFFFALFLLSCLCVRFSAVFACVSTRQGREQWLSSGLFCLRGSRRLGKQQQRIKKKWTTYVRFAFLRLLYSLRPRVNIWHHHHHHRQHS